MMESGGNANSHIHFCDASSGKVASFAFLVLGRLVQSPSPAFPSRALKREIAGSTLCA